jgi:hypothetical protein
MRKCVLVLMGFIASAGVGCTHAFDIALDDANKALDAAPKDENYVRARYCLNRAASDDRDAEGATVFDVALVVLGGAAAGTGSTFGSVSAALDAEDALKEPLGVWGTALVGASAGLLLLRTALNLSETSRTARVAASKRLDAATRIMDPASDKGKVFKDCVAEDIKVASASPGVNGGNNDDGPPSGDGSERELRDAASAAATAEARRDLLEQSLAAEEKRKVAAEARAAAENTEEARKEAELAAKKVEALRAARDAAVKNVEVGKLLEQEAKDDLLRQQQLQRERRQMQEEQKQKQQRRGE